MALQWKASMDVASAKTKINEVISSMGVPSFAKVEWKADELYVLVEQGGKSEFRMAAVATNGGSEIKETHRKVALFHKPFTGQVEKFVEEVMQKAGLLKL